MPRTTHLSLWDSCVPVYRDVIFMLHVENQRFPGIAQKPFLTFLGRKVLFLSSWSDSFLHTSLSSYGPSHKYLSRSEVLVPSSGPFQPPEQYVSHSQNIWSDLVASPLLFPPGNLSPLEKVSSTLYIWPSCGITVMWQTPEEHSLKCFLFKEFLRKYFRSCFLSTEI